MHRITTQICRLDLVFVLPKDTTTGWLSLRLAGLSTVPEFRRPDLESCHACSVRSDSGGLRMGELHGASYAVDSPQQVWKGGRTTMISNAPPTPHRLWSGHLSSVNSPGCHCQWRMSGMFPCGQWASEPVFLLPVSGNKGNLLHLSPLWISFWTGPEEFLT